MVSTRGAFQQRIVDRVIRTALSCNLVFMFQPEAMHEHAQLPEEAHRNFSNPVTDREFKL